MQFPLYIGLGAWKIHPHFLFESLGYAIAAAQAKQADLLNAVMTQV